MRKDAKLELLRQVPLFAGCTKRELSEITMLADELSLPEGTTLIRRASRATSSSYSSTARWTSG